MTDNSKFVLQFLALNPEKARKALTVEVDGANPIIVVGVNDPASDIVNRLVWMEGLNSNLIVRDAENNKLYVIEVGNMREVSAE